MAVFLGLDVHRAQITFDALDVETGEVQTGRVRPANRDTFARFLGRFDGAELVAAVEAMTGWRLVVGTRARRRRGASHSAHARRSHPRARTLPH
jgi:hypothetical protein